MFQKILLGTIGLLMLLYLLPANIARDLTLMVAIAILLIVILAARARAWFNNENSSFDIALIIGAFITLIHLFTFSALDKSGLSVVVTLLFATFFGLLAALMQEHESISSVTYARTYNAVPVAPARPRKQHHIDHAHDPEFRKGIEPIPEHAPPHHIPKFHHRVRAAVRHVFRPKVEPLHELHPVHTAPVEHTPEFKKGIEPIPEVAAPKPAKQHSKSFKTGIEPIHEITPAHLHKLGVYDLEKKRK